MRTGHDVHRLTIAGFEAAGALGGALDAIDEAGVARESLCVTGAAGPFCRAAQALETEGGRGRRFLVLFEQPVPVLPLGDGSFAVSNRNGLLARFKSQADENGQFGAAAYCPLSKGHQREMIGRILDGAIFLIAGAADNEQYVRCQSLLLRHSSARVLGVQFTWQTLRARSVQADS